MKNKRVRVVVVTSLSMAFVLILASLLAAYFMAKDCFNVLDNAETYGMTFDSAGYVFVPDENAQKALQTFSSALRSSKSLHREGYTTFKLDKHCKGQIASVLEEARRIFSVSALPEMIKVSPVVFMLLLISVSVVRRQQQIRA